MPNWELSCHQYISKGWKIRRKRGPMQKWSKMLTQKVPLGHLLPPHPLIQSQLFPSRIFSSHFLPGRLCWPNIQLINKPNSGVVADEQFWKYIGLHLFPLRRLLVDNCVERAVNYKKNLWRLHFQLLCLFWLNYAPLLYLCCGLQPTSLDIMRQNVNDFPSVIHGCSG